MKTVKKYVYYGVTCMMLCLTFAVVFGGGVIAKAAGAYGSYVKSSYGLIIQKEWDDNNNAAGSRPKDIHVEICVASPNNAGSPVIQEIVLDEDNEWKYELKEYYEFYPNGFEEDKVLGYKTEGIRVTDKNGKTISYS